MTVDSAQMRKKRGVHKGLCRLAFRIRAFSVICLRAAIGRTAELAKTIGTLTKRIERTLTTESAADGCLTYEEDHLNFGKNSLLYKTNHLQLPRVSPPTPIARKNKRKTDKTNRVYLEVKCAEGTRLTYEKEPSHYWKTSESYRTNHPNSPPALPPFDPNTNILSVHARNNKRRLLSNTQAPIRH
jgi:hypothetical protein